MVAIVGNANVMANETADLAFAVGIAAHLGIRDAHAVQARYLGQVIIGAIGRGDLLTTDDLVGFFANNSGGRRRLCKRQQSKEY